MDYGDLIRLIIFGFIFLSFFSGLFGGKKNDKKQPKKPKPKPVRPTELSESGGSPRPVVIGDPAGPMTVYTGEGVSRTEARREELRERFGGEPEGRSRAPRDRLGGELIGRSRDPREMLERDFRDTDRPPLERDVRDTEGKLLERDITDMPTIAEDLDPENRPRRHRQQEQQRRRRYVEGGDVLRHSLKDPATLERAFIVKEVLDRPLSLRGDR